MKSSIEIVAEYRAGATAVTRIRGGGHFAGRLTGPGEVHLIGTAAGPLGGDHATVQVTVGPGATLRLRSAAATIILPNRHRPDSVLAIVADVSPGGHLDLALEPTVVCAGAEHHAQTEVQLHDDARLTLREDVVLGRSGEPGGDWAGRTWLLRDGRAELRHTIRSRILGAGVRAVSTRLRSGVTGEASTCGTAVQMPLAAGGMLATAAAATLKEARLDLDALELAVQPSL